MAYRVLGKTQELLAGYGPRKGLEGPFIFANGQVLYYDPVQGQYWDPRTDFYVENDEMVAIHYQLIQKLS